MPMEQSKQTYNQNEKKSHKIKKGRLIINAFSKGNRNKRAHFSKDYNASAILIKTG